MEDHRSHTGKEGRCSFEGREGEFCFTVDVSKANVPQHEVAYR